MWPHEIVIVAPVFDHGSGLVQTGKPFGVQALVSQFAIERFDVAVLRGFARIDEVQLHFVLISLRPKGTRSRTRL